MGKYDKLILRILRILRGSSDANIAFMDLCELLKKLGFYEHVRGSHHVFRRERKRSTYKRTEVKPSHIKYVRFELYW